MIIPIRVKAESRNLLDQLQSSCGLESVVDVSCCNPLVLHREHWGTQHILGYWIRNPKVWYLMIVIRFIKHWKAIQVVGVLSLIITADTNSKKGDIRWQSVQLYCLWVQYMHINLFYFILPRGKSFVFIFMMMMAVHCCLWAMMRQLNSTLLKHLYRPLVVGCSTGLKRLNSQQVVITEKTIAYFIWGWFEEEEKNTSCI